MLLKTNATRTLTRAALASLLALPCFAFAQVQAYTNQPVNLMAGPDDSYPVVTGLGPNQPLTVMGCVSDYSWCDVALDDLRGWIYGDAINYPYEGNYVPLPSYGAVIGLPVVVFSIDSYWGRYYQGRPWYGDRDRWRNEPPHGNPPPHPPGGGYGGHPPPPQGGQPVYRPQTSPIMPPRGPQGQQPPQYGRPPEQGQPQQGYGRPPEQGQPQQGYGRAPEQGQPQQGYGRPPEQGQPQQGYGRPPVQGQPQAQYGHPPVQGQPQGQMQAQPQGRPMQPQQPQYSRPPAQPQARPQPQGQPQGRGEPNQGHRDQPQN
ncbi:SH3 domain-containing protein [Paraburkholderia sp. DHOC27]|uniref:SH3 domain-containing protein n=1 Tax=Paraburkholderia sp. DHOC27 TaxID=2303330 RepID=UPI000E3D5BF0|nr:SH3 domain-containing protein [Paraburkholderia sp. DHOC27]RFU47686.1 peptide-binding protein [Paraburkholderia sp. DHOC27]